MSPPLSVISFYPSLTNSLPSSPTKGPKDSSAFSDDSFLRQAAQSLKGLERGKPLKGSAARFWTEGPNGQSVEFDARGYIFNSGGNYNSLEVAYINARAEDTPAAYERFAKLYHQVDPEGLWQELFIQKAECIRQTLSPNCSPRESDLWDVVANSLLTEAGIQGPAAFNVQAIKPQPFNPLSRIQNKSSVITVQQSNSRAQIALPIKAGASEHSSKIQTSPLIQPEELLYKSRSQIRELAIVKGLIPFGDQQSLNYPRKWKDPVTGAQRLRLDRAHIDGLSGQFFDHPTASLDHVHGYEKDGKTKLVHPVTQDPHFPTQGE